MAEFEDPRPKSPGDSDAIDDVYGLAGDGALDPDDEGAGLEEQPDLLDDPEDGKGRDGAKPRPSAPPVAPLPRIWKVAPETQSDRPIRREARESKPARPEKAPPPASPGKAPPSASPERARRGRPPEPPPEKKPARPASTGHRREGGEIERIGRLRKPSEAPEEPAKPQKRAAKRDEPSRAETRRGRGEAEPDDTKKKTLVEETPNLDTYEARQRARVIVGVLAGAVCLVVGFIIVRSFLPEPSIEDTGSPEPQVAVAPSPSAQPSREQLEQEARGLFERARESAKRGDAKLAVSLLTRVVSTYPNTQAAAEAKEALARPGRNLPLFLQTDVVVASELKGKPKPQPAAPKVVDATVPAMPKPGTEEVGLVFPPNPAEAGPGNPAAAPAPEDPAAPIGRPLPRGFRAKPGTSVHESGWAMEILGDRDGAPMVLVPGGEFVMGSDDGDLSERPAHIVFVSTFYVDQHEVTARQFDLFQKEVGRRIDRVRALEREGTQAPAAENTPVVMVSAKEAKDYATWAGKKLPTEAQWEKAARGPDGRIYPWGNLPPQWKTKREPRQIEPILTHAEDVSPYGAYDMAGNAWEWTKDWYDSRYYVLVQKQHLSDPAGPTLTPRTQQLAVKGGSKTWHVSRREGLKWDTHLPHVGFRCVMAVEGPDNAFEPPPKPAPPPGTPPPGSPGLAAPPPF